MTQTSNRMFDELARLMTEAASVAQGVGREAQTAFRSQAERWVADLDLVQREEFDAVKEMAANARAENEKLAKRIAELEAKLEKAPAKRATTRKPKAAAEAKPAKKAAPETKTDKPEA